MQMTFAKRLTPFMKPLPFTDDKSTLRDVILLKKFMIGIQWLGYGIGKNGYWIWENVMAIMMRCKYETYYFDDMLMMMMSEDVRFNTQHRHVML
jgi:hypothetical protein